MADGDTRLWDRLSVVLQEAIGMHLPPSKRPELVRRISTAAPAFGMADGAACARLLLGSPLDDEVLGRLARYLTVGETYLFRDPAVLDALQQEVSRALRSAAEARVRIWSAGCSTGEEPYSIAMTLASMPPALRDRVSIVATDLDSQALNKAAEATYGPWSFRNAPATLRERFFQRSGHDRWQLAPSLRSTVRFRYLNLASREPLPAFFSGMDIIFCRNVLMYFHPDAAKRVLARLAGALAPGGWLVLSPVETARFSSPELSIQKFGAGFALRKVPGTTGAEPSTGRRVLPVHAGGTEGAERHDGWPVEPERLADLARRCADEGRLCEAQAWCEQALAADRLNPDWHYLLSTIHLEQRRGAECEASLQRAIFIDPAYGLAHFALGSLQRAQGRMAESRRHFRNALAALARHGGNRPLSGAGGMPAGRLAQIAAKWLASP